MTSLKRPTSLPEASKPLGVWPHPWLSALLALTWLALSRSLEPVHLLSAVLIGWLVPRLVSPFLFTPRSFNWTAAIQLTCVVLWDIVMSNITVARLVLGPLSRMKPCWVPVPLSTRHPQVNALFATIITTTPGTVSAVVDEERGLILVHALNCTDPKGSAADMKQRYELPLMRIFGVAPGSLE